MIYLLGGNVIMYYICMVQCWHSQCSTSKYQQGSGISDYKQCGGDFFNSMCYNGTCVNLDTTCRKHFMFGKNWFIFLLSYLIPHPDS